MLQLSLALGCDIVSLRCEQRNMIMSYRPFAKVASCSPGGCEPTTCCLPAMIQQVCDGRESTTVIDAAWSCFSCHDDDRVLEGAMS